MVPEPGPPPGVDRRAPGRRAVLLVGHRRRSSRRRERLGRRPRGAIRCLRPAHLAAVDRYEGEQAAPRYHADVRHAASREGDLHGAAGLARVPDGRPLRRSRAQGREQRAIHGPRGPAEPRSRYLLPRGTHGVGTRGAALDTRGRQRSGSKSRRSSKRSEPRTSVQQRHGFDTTSPFTTGPFFTGAFGSGGPAGPDGTIRSATPETQSSGLGAGSSSTGRILASAVERTARAIQPVLVALLGVAILLLGLASLPQAAISEARFSYVLARHRAELAGSVQRRSWPS